MSRRVTHERRVSSSSYGNVERPERDKEDRPDYCEQAGKISYHSREHAMKRHGKLTGGARMIAYRCPGNSHWHLSSRKPSEDSRKQAANRHNRLTRFEDDE